MTNAKGNQMKLNKWGYIFCVPFVVVFLTFNLWPTIYTFMLSFGDLRGLKVDFSFVGLTNFTKMLHDKYFWGAVGNTFIIWGLNFAPQLGLALVFAIWLTDVKLHLRGKNLFRALFYMPNLLTAASVTILYRSIFGYPIGPVNQIAMKFFGATTAYNFFRDGWATRYIVAFVQWWMW